MTAALMIQGTGSDVGKSLIVAGLARAYTKRGLTVRPFKPQNMSNNAAVTADGGEIGRAQALHARACGIAPSIHMNPILLKPETDTGAQVIVQGKRQATMKAREWMDRRMDFMPAVLSSFAHLGAEADLVLIEGAGSPAEVNLRTGDVANMGFAHAADVPVLLVGDIHRGGVIASIVGTFEVIDREDAARIHALLVNRFHGDRELFADGVRLLEERTGRPCAGVVPYFAGAYRLPAEDAVALDTVMEGGDGALRIAVPRLSRIANFDDLDPLRLTPGASVEIIQPGKPLPGNADLIILPGTKSTIGDMHFLREQGWDIDIAAHVRRGGRVLGLCGGYQMLGKAIHDPDNIEGGGKSIQGLGLLDVETVLGQDKTLTGVKAVHEESQQAITGYEMHLGRTKGADCDRPFSLISDNGTSGNGISDRADGARSRDGFVEGTYLHGIFASDKFRAAYLSCLGMRDGGAFTYDGVVEETLDQLADHLEAHADLDLLLAIARGKKQGAGSLSAAGE